MNLLGSVIAGLGYGTFRPRPDPSLQSLAAAYSNPHAHASLFANQQAPFRNSGGAAFDPLTLSLFALGNNTGGNTLGPWDPFGL